MEAEVRDWLTVQEVARELRLPRSRAYELVARGEIPAVRIGSRTIRVHRGQLEQYLLTQRQVTGR